MEAKCVFTMLAPRLQKGDTIGVFSPSYPASATQADAVGHAIDFLHEKGFNVKCGALTGKRDFYRSGSIKERADELNELIASPDVRCIMPISGGFVSNSLLPYINYEGLVRNPKIVVGFSDATAILLGIYAKTGLVTFYGPNLTLFGRKPPMRDETYEYMKNVIINAPNLPYALPAPICWTEDYIDAGEDFDYTLFNNEMITVCAGSAEGRLIACNLNAVSGFMARDYQTANKVVFSFFALKPRQGALKTTKNRRHVRRFLAKIHNRVNRSSFGW